jgi:hypothetical protein
MQHGVHFSPELLLPAPTVAAVTGGAPAGSLVHQGDFYHEAYEQAVVPTTSTHNGLLSCRVMATVVIECSPETAISAVNAFARNAWLFDFHGTARTLRKEGSAYAQQ